MKMYENYANISVPTRGLKLCVLCAFSGKGMMNLPFALKDYMVEKK